MLLNIILAVVVIVLVAAAGLYLVLQMLGKEHVVVDKNKRTPFEVVEMTEDSLTFSTTLEFLNDGKSCATVMDCLVRPHLPYEQYDGIETRGHAELSTAPREDDYFEAVLIQKGGDKINIKAQVKLIARKGMNIKEAISHMPDFNFQIIWLETGRTPCHYRQVRIEVPAAEMAKLAGTKLVED